MNQIIYTFLLHKLLRVILMQWDGSIKYVRILSSSKHAPRRSHMILFAARPSKVILDIITPRLKNSDSISNKISIRSLPLRLRMKWYATGTCILVFKPWTKKTIASLAISSVVLPSSCRPWHHTLHFQEIALSFYTIDNVGESPFYRTTNYKALGHFLYFSLQNHQWALIYSWLWIEITISIPRFDCRLMW